MQQNSGQNTINQFKLNPVSNVLLQFPGWMTYFLETVCNGVRHVLSCLVGVSKMSALSAATYKPHGIKETAHTMGPSNVAQYTQQLKILDYMIVVRVL